MKLSSLVSLFHLCILNKGFDGDAGANAFIVFYQLTNFFPFFGISDDDFKGVTLHFDSR